MDTYTTLIAGTAYQHTNGSTYFCKEVLVGCDAVLERTGDKWMLIAHGTRMTADALLHWDYSTGGHWA